MSAVATVTVVVVAVRHLNRIGRLASGAEKLRPRLTLVPPLSHARPTSGLDGSTRQRPVQWLHAAEDAQPRERGVVSARVGDQRVVLVYPGPSWIRWIHRVLFRITIFAWRVVDGISRNAHVVLLAGAGALAISAFVHFVGQGGAAAPIAAASVIAVAGLGSERREKLAAGDLVGGVDASNSEAAPRGPPRRLFTRIVAAVALVVAALSGASWSTSPADRPAVAGEHPARDASYAILDRAAPRRSRQGRQPRPDQDRTTPIVHPRVLDRAFHALETAMGMVLPQVIRDEISRRWRGAKGRQGLVDDLLTLADDWRHLADSDAMFGEHRAFTLREDLTMLAGAEDPADREREVRALLLQTGLRAGGLVQPLAQLLPEIQRVQPLEVVVDRPGTDAEVRPLDRGLVPVAGIGELRRDAQGDWSLISGERVRPMRLDEQQTVRGTTVWVRRRVLQTPRPTLQGATVVPGEDGRLRVRDGHGRLLEIVFAIDADAALALNKRARDLGAPVPRAYVMIVEHDVLDMVGAPALIQGTRVLAFDTIPRGEPATFPVATPDALVKRLFVGALLGGGDLTADRHGRLWRTRSRDTDPLADRLFPRALGDELRAARTAAKSYLRPDPRMIIDAFEDALADVERDTILTPAAGEAARIALGERLRVGRDLFAEGRNAWPRDLRTKLERHVGATPKSVDAYLEAVGLLPEDAAWIVPEIERLSGWRVEERSGTATIVPPTTRGGQPDEPSNEDLEYAVYPIPDWHARKAAAPRPANTPTSKDQPTQGPSPFWMDVFPMQSFSTVIVLFAGAMMNTGVIQTVAAVAAGALATVLIVRAIVRAVRRGGHVTRVTKAIVAIAAALVFAATSHDIGVGAPGPSFSASATVGRAHRPSGRNGGGRVPSVTPELEQPHERALAAKRYAIAARAAGRPAVDIAAEIDAVPLAVEYWWRQEQEGATRAEDPARAWGVPKGDSPLRLTFRILWWVDVRVAELLEAQATPGVRLTTTETDELMRLKAVRARLWGVGPSAVLRQFPELTGRTLATMMRNLLEYERPPAGRDPRRMRTNPAVELTRLRERQAVVAGDALALRLSPNEDRLATKLEAAMSKREHVPLRTAARRAGDIPETTVQNWINLLEDGAVLEAFIGGIGGQWGVRISLAPHPALAARATEEQWEDSPRRVFADVLEMKQAAVQALDNGHSLAAVAHRVGAVPLAVEYWRQQRRTGDTNGWTLPASFQMRRLTHDQLWWLEVRIAELRGAELHHYRLSVTEADELLQLEAIRQKLLGVRKSDVVDAEPRIDEATLEGRYRAFLQGNRPPSARYPDRAMPRARDELDRLRRRRADIAADLRFLTPTLGPHEKRILAKLEAAEVASEGDTARAMRIADASSQSVTHWARLLEDNAEIAAFAPVRRQYGVRLPSGGWPGAQAADVRELLARPAPPTEARIDTQRLRAYRAWRETALAALRQGLPADEIAARMLTPPADSAALDQALIRRLHEAFDHDGILRLWRRYHEVFGDPDALPEPAEADPFWRFSSDTLQDVLEFRARASTKGDEERTRAAIVADVALVGDSVAEVAAHYGVMPDEVRDRVNDFLNAPTDDRGGRGTQLLSVVGLLVGGGLMVHALVTGADAGAGAQVAAAGLVFGVSRTSRRHGRVRAMIVAGALVIARALGVAVDAPADTARTTERVPAAERAAVAPVPPALSASAGPRRSRRARDPIAPHMQPVVDKLEAAGFRDAGLADDRAWQVEGRDGLPLLIGPDPLNVSWLRHVTTSVVVPKGTPDLFALASEWRWRTESPVRSNGFDFWLLGNFGTLLGRIGVVTLETELGHVLIERFVVLPSVQSPVIPGGGSPAAARAELQSAIDHVARVLTGNPFGDPRGSGVFLEGGWVLTNRHVVAHALERGLPLRVTGRTTAEGRVFDARLADIALDVLQGTGLPLEAIHDLALVKLDDDSSDGQGGAGFAAEPLRAGEIVPMLGYPMLTDERQLLRLSAGPVIAPEQAPDLLKDTIYDPDIAKPYGFPRPTGGALVLASASSGFSGGWVGRGGLAGVVFAGVRRNTMPLAGVQLAVQRFVEVTKERGELVTQPQPVYEAGRVNAAHEALRRQGIRKGGIVAAVVTVLGLGVAVQALMTGSHELASGGAAMGLFGGWGLWPRRRSDGPQPALVLLTEQLAADNAFLQRQLDRGTLDRATRADVERVLADAYVDLREAKAALEQAGTRDEALVRRAEQRVRSARVQVAHARVRFRAIPTVDAYLAWLERFVERHDRWLAALRDASALHNGPLALGAVQTLHTELETELATWRGEDPARYGLGLEYFGALEGVLATVSRDDETLHAADGMLAPLADGMAQTLREAELKGQWTTGFADWPVAAGTRPSEEWSGIGEEASAPGQSGAQLDPVLPLERLARRLAADRETVARMQHERDVAHDIYAWAAPDLEETERVVGDALRGVDEAKRRHRDAMAASTGSDDPLEAAVVERLRDERDAAVARMWRAYDELERAQMRYETLLRHAGWASALEAFAAALEGWKKRLDDASGATPVDEIGVAIASLIVERDARARDEDAFAEPGGRYLPTLIQVLERTLAGLAESTYEILDAPLYWQHVLDDELLAALDIDLDAIEYDVKEWVRIQIRARKRARDERADTESSDQTDQEQTWSNAPVVWEAGTGTQLTIDSRLGRIALRVKVALGLRPSSSKYATAVELGGDSTAARERWLRPVLSEKVRDNTFAVAFDLGLASTPLTLMSALLAGNAPETLVTGTVTALAAVAGALTFPRPDGVHSADQTALASIIARVQENHRWFAHTRELAAAKRAERAGAERALRDAEVALTLADSASAQRAQERLEAAEDRYLELRQYDALAAWFETFLPIHAAWLNLLVRAARRVDLDEPGRAMLVLDELRLQRVSLRTAPGEIDLTLHYLELLIAAVEAAGTVDLDAREGEGHFDRSARRLATLHDETRDSAYRAARRRAEADLRKRKTARVEAQRRWPLAFGVAIGAAVVVHALFTGAYDVAAQGGAAMGLFGGSSLWQGRRSDEPSAFAVLARIVQADNAFLSHQLERGRWTARRASASSVERVDARRALLEARDIDGTGEDAPRRDGRRRGERAGRACDGARPRDGRADVRIATVDAYLDRLEAPHGVPRPPAYSGGCAVRGEAEDRRTRADTSPARPARAPAPVMAHGRGGTPIRNGPAYVEL